MSLKLLLDLSTLWVAGTELLVPAAAAGFGVPARAFRLSLFSQLPYSVCQLALDLKTAF